VWRSKVQPETAALTQRVDLLREICSQLRILLLELP